MFDMVTFTDCYTEGVATIKCMFCCVSDASIPGAQRQNPVSVGDKRQVASSTLIFSKKNATEGG